MIVNSLAILAASSPRNFILSLATLCFFYRAVTERSQMNRVAGEFVLMPPSVFGIAHYNVAVTFLIGCSVAIASPQSTSVAKALNTALQGKLFMRMPHTGFNSDRD